MKFLVVVAFALFGASLSVDVDTTCKTYARVTTNLKAVSPQPSNVQTVSSATGGRGFPGLASGSIRIESPNNTTWFPICDPSSGDYRPLQSRQNGEKFCVYPASGEILFDPARTGQKGSKPAEIYCECTIHKNSWHGSHGRGLLGPDCNSVTGAYKAVQKYPDGACVCYSKDGKTKSADVKCDLEAPCTDDGTVKAQPVKALPAGMIPQKKTCCT